MITAILGLAIHAVVAQTPQVKIPPETIPMPRGFGPGQPWMFYHMGQAPAIAVGRIEAIAERRYVPLGTKGPRQATVFLFNVSDPIKGSKIGAQFRVIQDLGDLPWVVNGHLGSGYRIGDEGAPLVVGTTYLLFLAKSTGEGYETENGIDRLVSRSSEHPILGGKQGMYRIADGRLEAPLENGKRVPPGNFGRFNERPGRVVTMPTTILGSTLDEAKVHIREAIKFWSETGR